MGDLKRPLDAASLRKHLFEFYTPTDTPLPEQTLSNLVRQGWQKFRDHPPKLTLRKFTSNLGMIVISFLLALATWAFVIQQTDPAQLVRLENIPVQVEGLAPETVLIKPYHPLIPFLAKFFPIILVISNQAQL